MSAVVYGHAEGKRICPAYRNLRVFELIESNMARFDHGAVEDHLNQHGYV
jgi:hypothetical protein